MIRNLTIAKAIKSLKTKQLSLDELYDAFFSGIKKENDKFNIYLNLNKKPAINDKKIINTMLAGVPLAIKDNISTKNLITTASTTVLEAFEPQFNATIINKLNQAGGFVIGKTNLDAWAHGSSTETSQFDRTLNPLNTDYLPGGSSGGSAAAVAANLCLGAIGTETAGSIRQPAAWCGVVGLKPTYGRVSRAGIVAMASSTDSPGPIAKTVYDSALLLNALAGHDPYDSTTSPRKVPDFTKDIDKSIKDLRIGVIYHDLEGLEDIKDKFLNELKVFERLGAKIELTTALDPKLAIAVYTIVQRGEVSSNLARYDGIRYGKDRSFFGSEAKRRVMLGTYALSEGYADQYYVTAQKVRTLFINDFHNLFSIYDVLISPTSPGFAKKIGATSSSSMFGELEDMLLEPSSITGLPGINVPCYRDPKTNLFLGMNIVAPFWREDLCIRVGQAYETATEWNRWKNEK